MSTSAAYNDSPIDVERNRYPYSIVWTPIPLISWILPCIGHMGICTSEGVIHDFAGPYYVSVDNMSFGDPTKYVKLDLTEREINSYDKALDSSTNKYNSQDYNFFCNNCHSFVAECLNKLKYKGKNDYNMVSLWWIINTQNKYVSFGRFLQTYCGFFIIALIILLICFLT